MASSKRRGDVPDDAVAMSNIPTDETDNRPPKQAKLEGKVDEGQATIEKKGPGLEDQAIETLVNIFNYLPLSQCLKIEHMHSKFAEAVSVSLRHRKKVNLTEGCLSMEVPKTLTDAKFVQLMKRCEYVQVVEGVHPEDTRPPSENRVLLTSDGVIEGLKQCSKLKQVGTSSIPVFNFLIQERPEVQILGQFAGNRHGTFPAVSIQEVVLRPNMQVNSLNLCAVHVASLPEMPPLAELVLKWVVFTEPQPFQNFKVPHLQRFSMKHCLCTGDPQLMYEQLFKALGHAHHLRHLELVRVPFPGDCLHNAVISVSQPMGMHSFRFVSNLTMSMCSFATEVDLAHLIACCYGSIRNLHVQPSLSSNVLFTAGNAMFNGIEFLHLGYIDDFPACNDMDENDMEKHGLVPCHDTDCPITDDGMQRVFATFTRLKRILARNCPFVVHPETWFSEGSCLNLLELKLINCSQISTSSLSQLIVKLPCLENLILEKIGSPVADMVDVELHGSVVPSTATHAVVQALGMLGITNQCMTAMYAKDRVSHFTISNQTLRNVMITKCKYMAIMMKDCPRLDDFSLSECENLVSLAFQDSKVSRGRISKCPCLKPEGFLHSLASLPPTNSHLMVYHAKDTCVNRDDIELTLFGAASSYHVGVIYDQVCPHAVRTQVRMRAWIDWIERINSKLLAEGFPHAQVQPYDYNSPGIVRAGEIPPLVSSPDASAAATAASATNAIGKTEKGVAGGKPKKKLKKRMRGPPSKIETEWRCGREVRRYEGQSMAEGTMGDFVYIGDLPWMEELAYTKLLKNWKEAGMFAPTVPAVPLFRPAVNIDQCIEAMAESIEAKKAAGIGVHKKCLILIVSTAEEKERKK